MVRFVLAFLMCCGFSISHAAQKILVLGDSLSAGYGIGVDRSWPSLIDGKLRAAGGRFVIVNASISGETTAGGLSRLPALLEREHPATVVIALGANDGLRGLPMPQMRSNLSRMVSVAKSAKARVLLLGMQLPPNYGQEYGAQFAVAFRETAQATGVPLLPFLLEPVALDRDAFQADGLHPTAAAQGPIAEHVWKALAPLLK